MSTTPTPEDHRRAKLVADHCRLNAEPWQLEHLAAAIAEARADGAAAALRDARERADILRRAATR